MTKPLVERGVRTLAALLADAEPSRLPKYARLRDAVVQAIAQGEWKPGDQLPTEQEFTRSVPFSLGTVQKALRSLADDGILVRMQGSGTFVAQDRRRMEALQHVRFLNDAGSAFLPVYSEVVARRRVAESGPWSGLLGQAGTNIIRIDRTLDIAGEFVVFSRFYARVDRFSVLETCPVAELNGVNFKQVLRAQGGVPITHISERLVAAQVPDDLLDVLRTSPGAIGMMVEAIAYAGKSDPLYYQELVIPPTGRRLAIEITVS